MKAGDLKPGDLFTTGYDGVFLVLTYCDYMSTLDNHYSYEEPRIYAVDIAHKSPEIYGFDKDDDVIPYEP